mgnify:CR=1 FL=1
MLSRFIGVDQNETGIRTIREKMRETGVDACLIPTSDISWFGICRRLFLSVGNIFLVLLVRQELW